MASFPPRWAPRRTEDPRGYLASPELIDETPDIVEARRTLFARVNENSRATTQLAG